MELQDVEREFDRRLPPGAAMASAYADAVFRRCIDWDGCILVAHED
jgi:hypothetical protein